MKLVYIACLLIHMIDYVMGNSTKICSLPINPGHCKDLVPRFGYRPSKKECISFMFGGCKGNANNFESIMDCESECKGKKMQ